MTEEPTYKSMRIIGWPNKDKALIINFPEFRKKYFEGSPSEKKSLKEFLDVSIEDLGGEIGFYESINQLLRFGLIESETDEITESLIIDSKNKVDEYTPVLNEFKRLRREIECAEI